MCVLFLTVCVREAGEYDLHYYDSVCFARMCQCRVHVRVMVF